MYSSCFVINYISFQCLKMIDKIWWNFNTLESYDLGFMWINPVEYNWYLYSIPSICISRYLISFSLLLTLSIPIENVDVPIDFIASYDENFALIPDRLLRSTNVIFHILIWDWSFQSKCLPRGWWKRFLKVSSFELNNIGYYILPNDSVAANLYEKAVNDRNLKLWIENSNIK